MPSSTRARVIAVTVAAVVLVAGFAARPHSPSLSTDTTGDPGLAERARPLLEADARATAAVVEVDGDRIRSAYFGSDEGTLYEIGSVTKAMTGLLLADAVERGEVTEDTELGSLLDLGDAPAASVTLVELSGHHSGLPANPPGLVTGVGLILDSLRNHDPFTADLDELVGLVAAADLSGRGGYEYSNLGTAALGQALAVAAGTDYETLVRERIFEPLGMDRTIVPATTAELPAETAIGHGSNGRPYAPSAGVGWAPMGGVHSTGEDMGLFARAVLSGEAPGPDALDPRWDDEGDGVGLGWFVTDHDGTEVTWHNGMTGGFSAMLALDREADRAVVVLSDTPVRVDSVAVDLLLETT